MADTAAQADKQFDVTRTFNAPREEVFAAFATPEQVAEWWGPEGFDTPLDSVTIELRPGGRYDLVMIDSRTGSEFPVRQEVVEVSAPELLVLKSEPLPEFGLPAAVITRIELSDANGGTQMTLSTGPYTSEMAPNARMGWTQQFDKLERKLG
jgi:uncharacterized protein YndB with AHSA1/START domain